MACLHCPSNAVLHQKLLTSAAAALLHALLCCWPCREVEGPPPDDYPESDEDAVQQQQHLRDVQYTSTTSSSSSSRAGAFGTSGTKDPLGDLTWPLETSKTVSRGASSQLLAIGQGVGSSAAAAAAAAATAAGAGISSLLANRGKSTERQRPATSVRTGVQAFGGMCPLSMVMACLHIVEECVGVSDAHSYTHNMQGSPVCT
jgi:hypothetical protein